MSLPGHCIGNYAKKVNATDGPGYQETRIEFDGTKYTIPTTQPYLGSHYKNDADAEITCTLIAAGKLIIQPDHFTIFRGNLNYTIVPRPQLTTIAATTPYGTTIGLPVRINDYHVIVTYTLTEFEQYVGQCYFCLKLANPSRIIEVVLLAPDNAKQVRNRYFKNTSFDGTFTPFLEPPIHFEIPEPAGPELDKTYMIELAAPPHRL